MITRRPTLGALGAPQRGADGSFREPPWFTNCQPYQCGAPDQYITPQMMADCPFWGSRGVLNCSNPYCSVSPWCAGSQQQVSGGGTSTVVPPAPQGQAPVTPPASQTTPAAPPAQLNTGVPVTVQTDSGQSTIMMPAAMTPGTTDQALTPAMVRIPNIWDSLDPTRASQFEYRGLSRTFPPWISEAYRRSLAPRDSTAAAGDAGASGIPWWVWLAIGGAAYALRGKS